MRTLHPVLTIIGVVLAVNPDGWRTRALRRVSLPLKAAAAAVAAAAAAEGTSTMHSNMIRR
jgi:hypothetical protein